ncbi:hypothetical protein H8356DRAFT_1351493 [Neocallimastix lanati (nom. inval.)]|nr:hypothetical protein H8356DRAFT_1351493 [Neocallimastix sp. JGI-2020a]
MKIVIGQLNDSPSDARAQVNSVPDRPVICTDIPCIVTPTVITIWGTNGRWLLILCICLQVIINSILLDLVNYTKNGKMEKKIEEFKKKIKKFPYFKIIKNADINYYSYTSYHFFTQKTPIGI